jgi:hypothetical protein
MREKQSVMALSNVEDGERHATRDGKNYVELESQEPARTAAPVIELHIVNKSPFG